MKMPGEILKYSEKNLLGYIKGADEIIYLFYKDGVSDDLELVENEMVKFNIKMTSDINRPCAVDIEKF